MCLTQVACALCWFERSGDLIVTVGTSDGEIHVVSVAWLKCEKVLRVEGLDSPIQTMHRLPNQTSCLCLARNGENVVFVWDVCTGVLLCSLEHALSAIVCDSCKDISSIFLLERF